MKGSEIKAARERAGMSQADLAAMIGVTRSAVNQWESGTTRPSTPSRTLLRMTLHDLRNK